MSFLYQKKKNSLKIPIFDGELCYISCTTAISYNNFKTVYPLPLSW